MDFSLENIKAARAARDIPALRALQEAARTDKLYLSRLLGYDFCEDVHTDLLNQYIKFDRTKPLFDQSATKHRLTLWSRGFFKTTSIIVEAVQLILNFPDISIMLMQSTVKNTKGLLGEVRGHFNGTNPKSNLELLFPKFCTNKLGTALEFTVPARTRSRKDPTVFVASPKSTKAGLHPDVGFFDDLVTELNYRNPDQMRKVIEEFAHYTPLVNPGGYFYVTGTRYTFGDLYEHIMRTNDGRWQITVRGCWTENSNGTKTSNFPVRRLEDGRQIGISVEMLEGYRRDSPETFSAQYLNKPISGKDQLFPESLIMSRVVSVRDPDFPKLGPTILAIDLASTPTDTADHTVILAGQLDALGRIYVIDSRAGQWSPAMSAPNVIDMVLRHRPQKVLIEHTAAAAFFIEHLNTLARDRGISLPLVPIKVANAKGAKFMRIAALEGRINSKGLFFLATLPDLPLLVEQFAQFPKGRHDDLPDTVGILVQHFAALVPQRPPRQPSIFDAMRAADHTATIVKAVEAYRPEVTLGSFFA